MRNSLVSTRQSIGRARYAPDLPGLGWKRRRDGWQRVVLPWELQKTLDLPTRQQISTRIVNTSDVHYVHIEVIRCSNVKQRPDQFGDSWLA